MRVLCAHALLILALCALFKHPGYPVLFFRLPAATRGRQSGRQAPKEFSCPSHYVKVLNGLCPALFLFIPLSATSFIGPVTEPASHPAIQSCCPLQAGSHWGSLQVPAPMARPISLYRFAFLSLTSLLAISSQKLRDQVGESSAPGRLSTAGRPRFEKPPSRLAQRALKRPAPPSSPF